MTFITIAFLAGGVLLLAALFLRRRCIRLGALAAGVPLLLFGCLAVLPAYIAISPEGPFAMGTVVLDAKQYERKGMEHLAPAVEIRYPTDVPSLGQMAAAWSWPDGQPGAPAARSSRKFPVIFYFSGWPGTGVDSLTLVRELVSRGFVVVTVHYSKDFPGLSPLQRDLRSSDLLHGMSFPSEEGFRETVAFCDNRARERAKDASAILDALIRLNTRGEIPASIPLDTDRTGIMGFSFGGAIASQARRQDARFKAAVNLDGWHFAEALDGVPPPHMFVLGDDTPYPSAAELASPDLEVHYNALLNQREYDRHITGMRRDGGFVLAVYGTDHSNFSGGNFQGSMLRRLLAGSLMHRPGGLGTINPSRAYRITSGYTLAFFEQFLNGKPSPLLDPSSAPYPEAKLEAWPAPAVTGAGH
jgi:dienelactone hydrolase